MMGWRSGLALAVISLSASAESLTPIAKGEPLGTYSNITYGRSEGYDGFMGGVEITVTKGAKCSNCKVEHFVILQCAQGVPGAPSVFPADLVGNKITFNISANGLSECTSEDSQFSGAFNNGFLVGRFGNAGALKLKRQLSVWDRIAK
jgi:hypothetical protein